MDFAIGGSGRIGTAAVRLVSRGQLTRVETTRGPRSRGNGITDAACVESGISYWAAGF